MADLGLGEGWIAAVGATVGAIALKVAERLLARKKDAFEQTLAAQRTDQERITQLWGRLDAMQMDRDRLLTELREERHAYDELKSKYDELRLIIRGRERPNE